MRIRKATVADLPVVLPLAERFHREDGHPLAPTGAAAIGALLAGSPLGEIFLVDEARGGYFVLCFTMSLEFGGLVVILDDLFLLPEARGRGLGGEVLAFVQEAARAKGAVQIFLEVEDANERAFAFYEHHGFRQRRRRMMDKTLESPSPGINS